MEDRPRPLVDAGEVEIAVTAAGICGLDLAGFLGRSRHHAPPLILGHELAGCAADGRRCGGESADELRALRGLPEGAEKPCARSCGCWGWTGTAWLLCGVCGCAGGGRCTGFPRL